MHITKSRLVLLALVLLFGITTQPALAQQTSGTYMPLVASGAASSGATQIAGEADKPVTAAIPQLDFTMRPEDYSDDHPQLGGLMISFNTLYLVLTLDTTIGEANAILNEIGATIVGGMPGVEGESEGILMLRLPTTTHEEMIAAIKKLYSHPKVEIAVQNTLLEEPEPQSDEPEASVSNISQPNGGAPTNWTWQLAPAGDNWGLELIRVPQMWNFNAAIIKQKTSAITGVLDSGFHTSHPDLIYLENLSPSAKSDHGTHVAGIIGATFNNRVGIDGVNPFAHLVVMQADDGPGWGLMDFILEREDLQVVNVSQGHNWSRKTPPINPNTNKKAQELVKDEAKLLMAFQRLIVNKFKGKLPFVVATAGNDSPTAMGLIDAKWNSPFTYASLVLGASNIIVVEAVQQNAGGVGGASRAVYSNVANPTDVNASVSAPGTGIVSTFFSAPYGNMNGTSMAAPHVAGLASYLLSLEPTLTHSELRKLLVDNAVIVGGGASPRVDAFGSALAIDTLRGNANILTKLLDIDDGTPDGNARVLCAGCVDYVGEDADSNGGLGDGNVDMADFRRWRDALLQVEAAPTLQLDGSANHPKKNLNGDGLVQTAVQENVYPRGDFNGDGILSRAATAFVPGAVNAPASDLNVLQKLFTDPHYQASALFGLIDSADLEVNAQDCLALANVTEVRSQLLISGTTTVVETRIHTPDERIHVFTAAINPAGYTLKVTAHDSTGKAVGIDLEDFSFTLGTDIFFSPICGKITLEPDLVEASVKAGETITANVRLISLNLEASYAITNSIAHVDVDLEQGLIEKDAEAVIQLSFSCGDETGVFTDDLGLRFTDDAGHLLDGAVPQAIDIRLVCTEEPGTSNGRIVIREQDYSAGANTTGLWKVRSESHISKDYEGTGQIVLFKRDFDDEVRTVTPIPALGFSEVQINSTVSGAFTYTLPTGEVRSHTSAANSSIMSSSTYTNSTATFVGAISSNVNESEIRRPYTGDGGSTAGATGFTIDLEAKATLEANWSCGEQIQPREIDLVRISTGGGQPVQIFNKTAPGCTYSGMLNPGRYVFNAYAGVSGVVDVPAEGTSSSLNYVMTFKFVE